jgi:hypothetical protein
MLETPEIFGINAASAGCEPLPPLLMTKAEIEGTA